MTDNAANMRHAFELMVETTEAEVDSNTAGDNKSYSDDESEVDLRQWKPNQLKIEGWLGCSAHQLQIVVHDGYAELLKAYRRVQTILTKAKTISSLSHKSSHFAYSLSHKIPVPCETRWNSYFRLYEHVIKHHSNTFSGEKVLH